MPKMVSRWQILSFKILEKQLLNKRMSTLEQIVFERKMVLGNSNITKFVQNMVQNKENFGKLDQGHSVN